MPTKSGHLLKKKHITSIENVQRRATKLISGFHDLEYSERLKRLASLPTLAYRRMRGDMIELYKIMTGKYDSDATPNIPRGPGNQTRGHQHKIFKERIRLNQRKYSFIPWSTDIWNNFPEVVKYAPSVATFEKRLDKFWKDHPQALDHPIKYDCTKSPYNPTGQRQHSHTTHQKHRVTEIYLELAAEAETPNQPEEDL